MTTLLVLNVGSSSLKFAVFHGQQKKLFGAIDQIGHHSRLTLGAAGARPVKVASVDQAINHVHRWLASKKVQPQIIAHRFVHGGGVYWRPARLTPTVLKRLQAMTDLAPLHLPLNLRGAALASQYWPGAQQWAAFDTAAFHQLPEFSQRYALPWAVSKKFHIRKYGFHGISHRWALEQGAKKIKRPLSDMQAVTIHLGAGDSISLWRQGKPVDTSMGFTPLEGLMMSTRSGDLDPAIPLFLIQQGYSVRQVEQMLQQQSGLFGLTGLQDMRDIMSAAGYHVSLWPKRRWTAQQRQRAKLALVMFIYDIQRYLGSYLGQLDRRAIIVFTGSIGQNPSIRKLVLAFPGARGRQVMTIPADEETAIAESVRRMVR